MRKTLLIIATIMTAGVVSAQIWSESFNTNSPPTLNPAGGVYGDITNEFAHGEWVHTGAELVGNGDGSLRLEVSQWSGDGHAGKTWAAGIALEESLFTAGAGTYRLTLNIDSTQGDARLGVRIWDASIGSGGTNNYYRISTQDYGPPGTLAKVIPVGDATTNLLAEAEFNSSHKGVRSIDFSYDGSGDIVVHLNALSSGAVIQRWTIIDDISLDVATPNAAVPSFTTTNYTILPPATENIPYTNAAFLASGIVNNPGFEALEYNVGKAAWMSIDSGGVITGTPTTGGTNTFFISVADNQGASDWATFSLFVTNNNDAPVINTWSNNIYFEPGALSGIPYSEDISGFVSDEDGDPITFSFNSGPAWLSISTNGIISGTPAGSDAGYKQWEFVVTDGADASTGTLFLAVTLINIVQYETFDSPTFVGAGVQNFSAAEATTTISNGTWIGNFSLPLNSARLRLYTPNNGDAIGTRSVMLDETLFTGGAGTYTLRFELKDLDIQFNTPTLYVDLYDASLDAGGSIDVDSYYFWGGPAASNYYAGLPGIIATNAPATVSLITNLSWVANEAGTRTAEFEYDGSGDVIVNIGASKPSSVSTDWWQIHIDDFTIYSLVASGYDLWVTGYGLNGGDAAATNDYDGDGWANLLEYGLGLNPTNGLVDGGAYPTFAPGASGMDYVHALRTDDPSLSYALLTTTDLTLGGWTETAFTTSTNVTGGAYDYVTNAIPTTDPQKFIRLQVEQTP